MTDQTVIVFDREGDPASGLQTWDPIAAADEIVSGFVGGPNIECDGFAASYTPITDTVQMPRKECFSDAPEWYSTIYHELSHATGSKSRLGREGVTDRVHFSSHAYSKEELIAWFYGNFSVWVSVTGLIIQTLVVARLLRHVGMPRSLMILPVISTLLVLLSQGLG